MLKSLATLILKKGEDRRIRTGHPWIYSNEIDTSATPLKNFSPGEEVIVLNHHQTALGRAYINPHSLIAARLFTRDTNQCLNIDFIKQRLLTALSLRTRLFSKPFYRLVFGESDGLPGLVIDRFQHDYVIQTNTAGMEQKQSDLLTALLASIPEISSILLRNDSPIRKHEKLENYIKALYGRPPEIIQLEENGISFSAPIFQGQKTGWFYDQRFNRARLKDYVNQQEVLDVFSYLGGFGIHAACFGATKVDCLDSSPIACDLITRNARQNHVEKKIRVIGDDAFDAMKRLLASNIQYGVVIVDPPAFVKKQADRKEGLIAYQRLNELAIKLLAKDGILISCSCSMHISLIDFIHVLQRVAYRTQTEIQILERGHQGPDHPIHLVIPETDYLKALFLRKLK